MRQSMVNARGLAVLGLCLVVRLVWPLQQPIFADEGINLYWAQEFARGHSDRYPLLMDGRFLFGALFGTVGIDGPAPLYYARLWVGVFATLGCAAAMALGHQLGGRRVGWLAGVCYALLPLAAFHERQALTDPLMGDVGALVLVGVLWAARRPGWGLALWCASAYAAAFLFKPSGGVYGLALGLAPFLLLPAGKSRWRFGGWNGLTLGLAGALTVGFLWVLGPRLGVNDERLLQQNLGFIQCPPLLCRADWPAQWTALQVVAPPTPEVLGAHLGWPLLGWACFSVFLSHGPARRRAAWLLAVVGGMLLFFILAGRLTLVPRYLTPLAAPLAALGAQGLWGSLKRLAPTRLRRHAFLVPLVGLLTLSWANTARLLLNPAQAWLPAFDRYQYLTGPVAGGAFQAVALTIAAADPHPLILTEHFMRYSLAAFFDVRDNPVRNPWEVTWATAQTPWATGKAVYLVDEVPPDTSPSTGQLFPYLDGTRLIRLRAVRASDPQAEALLYQFVYNPPQEIQGDYAALAANLPPEPAIQLVPYPPHQASVLGPLSPHPLVVLGEPTPWEPRAAIQTLTTLSTTARLQVVFLNETSLDPQRQVETWLNTYCYRAQAQWFGALRTVAYACGPTPTTRQIEKPALTFGNAITLQQVAVLDPHLAPGDVLRVRLQWHAQTTPLAAYKVFVHLFNAQGIVAQHDGQPVGELRPTLTWQPGETISDAFGLTLPNPVPPGTYQLRIGLYDADTQTRLLTATGAEFWEGGTIVIK